MRRKSSASTVASTAVMPMNRAVREVSEGGEGNIKKIVLVFPSSSEPD